jgi:hypothetical protein
MIGIIVLYYFLRVTPDCVYIVSHHLTFLIPAPIRIQLLPPKIDYNEISNKFSRSGSIYRTCYLFCFFTCTTILDLCYYAAVCYRDIDTDIYPSIAINSISFFFTYSQFSLLITRVEIISEGASCLVMPTSVSYTVTFLQGYGSRLKTIVSVTSLRLPE